MNFELGSFGIKVTNLETSNPDVLTGEDCVEKIHYVTKKPALSQLRGPSVLQGRIAAKRLAGYEKIILKISKTSQSERLYIKKLKFKKGGRSWRECSKGLD